MHRHQELLLPIKVKPSQKASSFTSNQLIVPIVDMKISMFFIILGGLLMCYNCEKRNAIRILTKRFSNLANAVNNATDSLFEKNSISLNMLTPKKYSPDISDFKDEILSGQLKTSKLRVTMETIGHFNGHVIKRGSVWVIRHYDDFLEIFKEVTPKSFRLGGHFLLVMIRGELKELPAIFRNMWKQQIFNVFAMFEDANQEVLVKNFRPFNAEKCDDMSPILINKYKDGQFVNGTSTFFARKMKNLFKCPVRVATSNNSEPYVFVKKSSNNSFALRGREISLVKTLAETLNFKLEFTYVGPNGVMFDNGSATGALEALLIGEADISAVAWLLKDNRLKYFDRTTPHVYETIVFVVPPGSELTSYQQMLYPFDFFVWLALCIFLLIGFIVIFVIKFQSKDVQKFVLGTGNRNPYTNMLIAFYGGSQTKLPRRNFARYLLMMFLIFSLVMRASYTGLFYKMLRSHERRGEAQSIQEMVQKDFKFYVDVGSADLFDGTEALKNR